MKSSQARKGRSIGPRIRRLIYASSPVAIAAILVIVSCTPQPGETSVQLGQQFTLTPGQSASVAGEPLKIKFLEVIADSRCPAGVTCIWQGEVSSLVEISHLETKNNKVLTQSGSGPAKTEFNDYIITFEVQPYPEAGKPIDKKDYSIQMQLDKRPALSGGILVTFQVIDETYSIFITNEQAIEQVFAVQRGESKATIPSGRLVRGSVPYNEPWSWHIDPEQVQMAEFTIELCDGKPSHVEANLDYWVDTVKSFCPWSARIIKIEDFR